jgi:hypothetical protein
MICSKLGTNTWKDLCRRHHAPEMPISLETYPDDMTSGIIADAAKLLEISVDDLLKDFGAHWIGFIMKSDYGDIIKFFGPDFSTSVANLDTIHASVSDAMRNARTPKFSVIHSNEQSIEIRYSSERAGLRSFVEGLLAGLLQHFKEKGKVSLLQSSDHQADFLISFDH